MSQIPQPSPPGALHRKGPLWTLLGLLLVLGIVGLAVFNALRPAPDQPAPSPQAAPTHLILISIDTLRADHLGCYGHGAGHTPEIDKLAAQGALFERHYTCYPLTLPAHLTQLTGVSSLGHRVRDNLYHKLPEQFVTLPEQLTAQGFTCGAFVSAFTMRSGSGLERGFSLYDDEGVHAPPAGKLTIPERKAEATLGRAARWLEQNRDQRRLFCFVHLFDPHAPYDPPADLKARYAGQQHGAYLAEIAHVDRQLGLFFEKLRSLGIYDQALIALTADHGEGLGEHDELSHGYFCYDSTTRVPLILRGGPVKAGIRPAGVVRNYDLAPTLADLLGIDDARIRAQAHGQSLRPMLEDPGRDLGLSCYIESHYAFLNANWAKIRGLRTRQGLTLLSGDFVEHYRDDRQTGNEPGHEQAARDREEIVRLLSSLKPPRGGKAKPGAAAQPGSPYPGESATEQDFEPENIHDTRHLEPPARNAALLLRYQQAELAYDEERFDTCAALLRRLISDAPGLLMAHKLLAGVNQQLVKVEWRQLGLQRAGQLTREAAESLRAGAEISEASGNAENASRLRLNGALLALWLNDAGLFESLAGRQAQPALHWLGFLLRYRLAAGDARREEAARAEAWLAGAELDGPVRTEAEKSLSVMKQDGELKLAPWE